ncbi:TonB-dependent receptor [Inhella crocodyli]|uniref:TonB-dependent receptor n=1 Tax=Inhella crocodyli TaxID=2499851 RepID=A0A437LS80_9BURK|nr:TonB-dependent receptor [Inhella crocodyli]RVT88260.1 TonB-dependent receptor [Inhella crocodyli]
MKSSRSGRDLFRVNAVTAGCLVALLAAGAVQAQQQLDTVVVTGIRKGIEDAISVKKNKDSIVEAISAEDIGKLPDASVAESIARLPGVTAQRTAGRAQQISIRGMAPDFATALLNGREQVTTGDSRGVEFDQYPSELLSSVLIYKTPDGALIGQGLSGTVDLQTVRPLNFKTRQLAFNVREQQTGVGLGKDREGDGRRLSAFYVDQFFDRTLGVALGWARFTEDGAQTSRFEGWGVADTDFGAGKVKTPGGFNSWLDQTVQTRTASVATLQFKPSKSYEASADLFFSKFDKDKKTKGFQAPVGFSSAGGYDPGGTLTTATVAGGIASAGTFNNFKGVVRNDTESTLDEMRSLGLNQKWTGDVYTAVLDLSASNARRTGGIMETTAGLAGPGLTGSNNTISWTGFDGSNVNSAKFTTGVNYGSASSIGLTDVMGWGGGAATPQAGYSKLPHVEDDLKALRFSVARDLPEGLFFSSVEVGVNESRRMKDRAYVEGRLVINGTDPYAVAAIPGASTINISGIPVVSWDPRGSVGPIYTVASKLVSDIANKDWTVKEKATTLYTKANLDTEVLGMPLRGNAGLQFINTKQDSTAFNVDGSACPGDVCAVRPNIGGANYHDILPSANFVLDLGNDQSLRLGLARVMARPTLNDMRASLGFGINQSYIDPTTNTLNPIFSGGAGNPALKPFRANAFDLSYEKFWGTKAYVSAAAFYKDLRTYILRKDVSFDYTPYVTASTPKPPRGNVGILNLPVNGSGGDIKGIELSASMPLEMVWKPLSGFGVQASYSSTSSSINLSTSGVSSTDINTGTIPLPGLSKDVASVQIYYERSGFQIRVGQRYRSDFVGEVSDFTGDRRLTYIKGESVTDAQIGYEFQSGPLKGLSVLLQGYNLGDAKFIRYRDTPSNEVENTKYGKSYLLGVNYKL